MKSPGIKQFFLIYTFFCWGLVPELLGQASGNLYEQGFEQEFSIGKEVEFLPGIWGNDVRSGASRLYQAPSNAAHSGNAALGVVPTGSFTGELRIAFDASELEAGEISFWMGSGRNGSGTRPAVVSIAFSADGGQSYFEEQQVGEAQPNADTPYQQYHIALPDEIAGLPEALLRIRVGRGSGGAGAAARVFIDELVISSHPLALRLMAAHALNQHMVQLHFNKELQPLSSTEDGNYHINKGVVIKSASLNEASNTKVDLEVDALQAGESYTITIGDVLDAAGNSAAGQKESFVFRDTYELRTYDLLISEIHAAPSEQTLLPNVEWVEIYNASDRHLSLEGVQFGDETRTAAMPPYSLGAGEYLLLASAADAPLLERYGSTVGLTPWPSLNNSGDKLGLYSAAGKQLDRIDYTQSWYNSSQKAQGGWSLERIDLNNPCLGASNWAAAIAHSGGTPGQVNSIATIKPDLNGPKILQAYAIDSFRIQLVFNEVIDTLNLAASNFQFNPPLSIESVRAHPLQPERLIISFLQPLEEDQEYLLKVENLADCSGNLVQQEFSQLSIAFPVAAGKGDVRINEVMYNPLANSEEWVEIANASENYINLQRWQLATYSQGIKSTAVLSRDYLILPPGGFLVFSRKPEGVQSAFPSVSMEKVLLVEGLAQLPNTGDSLALIEEHGEIHDLFGYSDALHSPFLSDTKGVSLERIKLEALSAEAANWTSASEASGGGTPGSANSQRFMGNSMQEEGMIVEPGIIVPNGNAPPNFTTIYLKSQRSSLQVNLSVFDSQGRKVRSLANHQLLGSDTIFTWDGANDSQNLVKTGYYVILMHVYNAGGYSEKFKKVVVVNNHP